MKLEAMKAVYCYYFPEVRPYLHQVESALPDEMYLTRTPAETVAQYMAGLFDPPLELTEGSGGLIDLDEIHQPVIQRILKAYTGWVPGLAGFDFVYPSSGSSEALFHLLVDVKVRGEAGINVLLGEYEGYAAQARNLGMAVAEHRLEDMDPAGIQPGTWFVSNPSARDGNILPDGFVESLCNAGHRVILDLAYVGATRPYVFDVTHQNIRAVVMSFSKPYGLFRFRTGGFCFARSEKPTLYGNKWFKDILRLFQALKVAEGIGPGMLYEKYRPIQEGIIKEINRDWGLSLEPSDVLLLANKKEADASPEERAILEPYLRGDTYRLCLTPYFEMRDAD